MIDVSILYPNEAGATFDFDYYREQHMTMIQQKMAGPAVTSLLRKAFKASAWKRSNLHCDRSSLLRITRRVRLCIRAACQGYRSGHRQLHQSQAHHSDQRSDRRLIPKKPIGAHRKAPVFKNQVPNYLTLA